jgi:hypothetical protein
VFDFKQEPERVVELTPVAGAVIDAAQLLGNFVVVRSIHIYHVIFHIKAGYLVALVWLREPLKVICLPSAAQNPVQVIQWAWVPMFD